MFIIGITITAIALTAILWVELVRDFYHFISHYWQPLYRLHNWHHRVFRPDLSVISESIYRKAQWYNDVPESLVMLCLSLVPVWLASQLALSYGWVSWLGTIYTLSFLGGAIARGLGIPGVDAITDITHLPGEFATIPGDWFVNRPYHWRHHFDNQKAYYCGTFTLFDKLMGTALSLKGKTIAVTGASGSLGQSLLKHLHQRGAKVIALTSQTEVISIEVAQEKLPVNTITWKTGQEDELQAILTKIDILIINHGINVHGDRDKEAIAQSYEVNTFSVWRLLELFLTTVKTNEDKVKKEVWINTSEAESLPCFSPLYELSKRTIGDLVTLRRLDAPCIIRKLILGPFKSNLNPIGVMSADWVAQQILNLAQRDIRNIIVTINPITFVAFPVKEFAQATYFKLFTKKG
jgi:hypothetical protein